MRNEGEHEPELLHGRLKKTKHSVCLLLTGQEPPREKQSHSQKKLEQSTKECPKTLTPKNHHLVCSPQLCLTSTEHPDSPK